MKRLIAYYSYEGNTKLIAENMAEETGADLLRLIPLKEMKSRGFMKFVWGGRQAVMGDTPPLKDLDRDISQYDLIIIGTPVWAGRPAPPVKTFMTKHLPVGKDLILFYTFEGGAGNTLSKMEEMKNGGNVRAKNGFMAPLKSDREAVIREARKWISSCLV
jgi:flavodoxin